MATFKPTIFKDRQRDDKTWNAFIRFYARKKKRDTFPQPCMSQRKI